MKNYEILQLQNYKDNGELTVCTTNGSKGQHVYVYPRHLSAANGCTSEFEIPLELALECGFIYE